MKKISLLNIPHNGINAPLLMSDDLRRSGFLHEVLCELGEKNSISQILRYLDSSEEPFLIPYILRCDGKNKELVLNIGNLLYPSDLFEIQKNISFFKEILPTRDSFESLPEKRFKGPFSQLGPELDCVEIIFDETLPVSKRKSNPIVKKWTFQSAGFLQKLPGSRSFDISILSAVPGFTFLDMEPLGEMIQEKIGYAHTYIEIIT